MTQHDFYEKSRNFVYRNARPLDFAIFRYHFEEGTAEEVLRILASYQNSDGGFGHALEPDNWNPASTPVATWTATQKLRALGVPETADGLMAQKTAAERNAAEPGEKRLGADELAEAQRIIDGILRYLESGADFAEGKWYNTVAGNNDYPHAVWWSCESETGLPDDNPTVSLAGFALCYAGQGSELYRMAEQIIAAAVTSFVDKPTQEMHTLKNYQELLSYLEESGRSDLVDMESFREKLYEAIRNSVCTEPERWYTEYVGKPSHFYDRANRLFAIFDRALCEKEADLMLEQQCPDGSWNITWQWCTEYREFEISANWWKSAIITGNLLYLKTVGRL